VEPAPPTRDELQRIAEELLRIGDQLPARPGGEPRRVTPRTLAGLFGFLFLPIAASFWGEFAHGDDKFGVVLKALAVTLATFVLVLAIALGSEAFSARRRRARADRATP
jgi:hypothetical protein